MVESLGENSFKVRADESASALAYKNRSHRQFESKLYKSVLERMGFDGLLAPEHAGQTAAQAPEQNEITMTAM